MPSGAAWAKVDCASLSITGTQVIHTHTWMTLPKKGRSSHPIFTGILRHGRRGAADRGLGEVFRPAVADTSPGVQRQPTEGPRVAHGMDMSTRPRPPVGLLGPAQAYTVDAARRQVPCLRPDRPQGPRPA
jgi:hypothetical protein